jgi:hypothetical protein
MFLLGFAVGVAVVVLIEIVAFFLIIKKIADKAPFGG